jgi:hypothetical protein
MVLAKVANDMAKNFTAYLEGISVRRDSLSKSVLQGNHFPAESNFVLPVLLALRMLQGLFY